MSDSSDSVRARRHAIIRDFGAGAWGEGMGGDDPTYGAPFSVATIGYCEQITDGAIPEEEVAPPQAGEPLPPAVV